MSSIPKIGEKYHFFDDGNPQNNSHYISECVEILTPEEAKNHKLSTGNTLYNYWKNECAEFKNYYRKSTDYFIGCSIPEYRDYIVWFVRTDYDDWAAFDIYDSESGILDVDEDLYSQGIALFGENYYTEVFNEKFIVKDNYRPYKDAKEFLSDSMKYNDTCYYLDETEKYKVSINGFYIITLILFDEKCEFKSYHYLSS